MCCWYLYFSVKIPFLLYSIAWVGAVSNMCDNCLFLAFAGLPSVFLFIYELLINALPNFFQKSINVSSLLSKYFIARYVFTSVHAMKKANTRMGHQVVSHLLSKQIGIYYRHHSSRRCDFPRPPCIYNYPQKLQDNWTCLPLHSPPLSLPFDPPAQ